MKAQFYLIIQGFKRRNYDSPELGTVMVRKNKPNVGRDEVAVFMDLDIPDALFDKPTLEVKAEIPEAAGIGPKITTEVTDNIAEIIREQTGLNVHISAGERDGHE